MILVWGAALVIFLIVELATVGLVSIWLAIGSLAGLIAAFCGAKLWLQVVLFLVVSILALAATRPLAKKFLNSKKMPTNADRVFTMAAVVVEEIDNLKGTGIVKVDGKTWTARSLTGEVIKMGTVVRPQSIEGVKLIVSVLEEPAIYS